jgi:hypothetical protein
MQLSVWAADHQERLPFAVISSTCAMSWETWAWYVKEMHQNKEWLNLSKLKTKDILK